MNDQLRRIYRQVANDVPDVGDARRAWRRGVRQRRVRVIGAPVAVAAVSAAVIIASVQEPWHDAAPNPAPPTPAERTVEPTRSVDEWVPETPMDLGRPARVGTVMYAACADGCETMLRRPDGAEFPLSDASTEVAAAVDAAGVENVSLSVDASWLGVPDGDDYVVYPLRGGEPGRLSADGADRWSLVGWGAGSFNWSLARWRDGRVVEYATADLWEAVDPTHFSVPDGCTERPSDHGGSGVIVAEPIATDGPPSSWPRLTTYDARWLTVLRGTGESRGSLISAGPPRDLSALLGPDETLAGPLGVPVERTGPVGSAEMDWPTVYVFDQADDTRTPIGAIFADETEVDGGWRFDVPESTAEDTWRVLGPLRAESLAVAHETADATEVVRIDRDGSRTVLQRLPAGSHVILPGASPIAPTP